jgi:hypothetical protein
VIVKPPPTRISNQSVQSPLPLKGFHADHNGIAGRNLGRPG